jgi:hypothetical protein
VNEDGGARQPIGDRVFKLVGQQMGCFETGAGGELEVQVNLVVAADVPRAQVVKPDDAISNERVQDAHQRRELIRR